MKTKTPYAIKAKVNELLKVVDTADNETDKRVAFAVACSLNWVIGTKHSFDPVDNSRLNAHSIKTSKEG
tara:strand:- start:953 stop:1159 length:207 start_codon:yes stop_codon:yes gene_type:complete